MSTNWITESTGVLNQNVETHVVNILIIWLYRIGGKWSVGTGLNAYGY